MSHHAVELLNVVHESPMCFRVIKMALVHDMAEAIVGDITPHCGVSDVDKFTLEKVSAIIRGFIKGFCNDK